MIYLFYRKKEVKSMVRSSYVDIFSEEIQRRISNMRGLWIDLKAGDIHTACGGYPGPNHRMKSCCHAMRKAMRGSDEILPGGPPKGNGASLKIRYYKGNHP
jgi:hypothetical protein